MKKRALLLFFIQSMQALASQLETQLPVDPFEKGQAMVNATQSELGKNLMQAIQQKQTVGAISFCHTKAIPITQEKMEQLDAQIKRATDKPRNPKNLADETEMKIIKIFQGQLKENKLKPILEKKGKRHFFYAPIVTHQMCLQCHGQRGSDIKPEVLSKIKDLYPEDQASGYQTNQLRGIFSVSWKD